MSIRSLFLAFAFFLMPLAALAPQAYAQPDVYTGRFSNTALQGYDPVTYFTQDQPAKGSKAITADWNGAEVRFVSEANRDAFLADPAAYAPQYGGYCAWAMADGKYAKGDARYWNIEGGKLYLNYNKSIQRKWTADIPGFIERADKIWQER